MKRREPPEDIQIGWLAFDRGDHWLYVQPSTGKQRIIWVRSMPVSWLIAATLVVGVIYAALELL